MLSSLRTVAQRSAVNQRILSANRSFSSTFAARDESSTEQKGNPLAIERATLLILQDSVTKEKAKPAADVGQRYQKIHRVGDTYHPQDLNDTRYQEQLRQRRGRSSAPTEDPFDVLGLDPLHEYKNYRLLSHFVSDMGKILPREKTGLTAKNQRKLAKAVKRARAMGIMSSTSKDNSSYSSRKY